MPSIKRRHDVQQRQLEHVAQAVVFLDRRPRSFAVRRGVTDAGLKHLRELKDLRELGYLSADLRGDVPVHVLGRDDVGRPGRVG